MTRSSRQYKIDEHTMPQTTQNAQFETVLTVDGSATSATKRPVYCWRRKCQKITRIRHPDGVLAILDPAMTSELPRPILIAADVPIGLPVEFSEVWKAHGRFLSWLDAQTDK